MSGLDPSGSGPNRALLEGQHGRIPTDNFSLQAERLVHQGAVVGFYEATIADRAGDVFKRDVVRHPGAVSVVAIDDGSVVLVQQYRTAVDADLLELPAGKRDVQDEPPEQTARRELIEEVGLEPGSMELLCTIHHSPGFCDEYAYIFLAENCTQVPDQRQGPEEAAMQVHRVPLALAAEQCLSGQITDSKTIVGVLAAARRYGV